MNFSTSLVQSIQSLTVSDSVRQAVDSIAVRAQQLADAFNSSDPKFIEENDIAIPVDIDLNQFNNLRLLLRPRIGTDIAKKVIDFMSADTINDEDMEYPPDDIIPGSSGSANKSETLRTENNVLHITGCLGSGKSHVLREVAWRVLYGFKNARIVYIPDCVEWAGHNYEAQLEYFCKAVMIGLARDTDSFSFGELKLQPDRAYFVEELVEMVIEGLRLFCVDHPNQDPPPRILFCFDRFPATTSDVINCLISELEKHHCPFYVILADENSLITSSHTEGESRMIPSWFSTKEARVFLDDIYNTKKIDLGKHKDSAFNAVSRCTDLNPKEIYLFFESIGNSADFQHIAERAYRFGRDTDEYVDDSLTYNINSRTDIARDIESMSVFRMYNNIPTASPFVGNGGRVTQKPAICSHPLIYVQPRFPDDDLFGEHVGFAYPRAANSVFQNRLRGEEQSLEAMRRLFNGNCQAIYELAFAAVKYALKPTVKTRQTLTIFQDTLRFDCQRIVSSVESVIKEIHRQSYYSFWSDVDNMAFFTSASPEGGLNKSSGLDFIVWARKGNRLDHILIAIVEGAGSVTKAINAAKNIHLGAPSAKENITPVMRVARGIRRAADISAEWIKGNRGCESTIYLLVLTNHVPKQKATHYIKAGTDDIPLKVKDINESFHDDIRNIVHFKLPC